MSLFYWNRAVVLSQSLGYQWVFLELERSKEVKTRFLNIQPSVSEIELPLRFIFTLDIVQVNKERNH